MLFLFISICILLVISILSICYFVAVNLLHLLRG